jgi:chemotaxis protein CheX
MRAEYINPFLTECKSLFKEAAGLDLEYKGTTIKKTALAAKNVAVMIGVTGDLRGTIIMNLDQEFAKKVASNMMGGMEIVEFDELPKSAISELGNMIMGRVSTSFYNKGMKIDITPPSLMTGDNIMLSVSSMPILSIRFTKGSYDLDFDISISEH